MKRLGYISIFLIVNILILTHTIVPHHHHHGNIPCFGADTSEWCSTHDAQQPSEDNAHEHDDCCNHSRPCQDGSCAIEDFVIYNDQNQKDGQECPVYRHSHFNQLLQAVLFIVEYNLSAPENELFLRRPPYLIAYHSVLAGQNSGLRAPPTV